MGRRKRREEMMLRVFWLRQRRICVQEDKEGRKERKEVSSSRVRR